MNRTVPMSLHHAIVRAALVAILASASWGSDADWFSSVGLLWPSGVEPAGHESTFYPVPSGKRVWYVDANASVNGNGTSGSPYWGFTETNAGLASGDHVYVTGDFLDTKQAAGRDMALTISNTAQMGTTTNPSVIRSWPGRARAKFDANYSTTTPVGVFFNVGTNDGTRGVVFINMEFTRCMRAGDFGSGYQAGGNMSLGGSDQGIAYARVVSCWIHHNWAPNTADGDNNAASSSGGVYVIARRTACDVQVYNCLTHDNNRNHLGHLTDDTNNGGINLLAESDVPAGSVVKFYNNLQYNEKFAIRHKHAGVISFEGYYNYAYNCVDHFYIRAGGLNTIHHNLFRDGSQSYSGFIASDAENSVAIRSIVAYNNTVVRVPIFFGTNGTYTYSDTLNAYSNIHYFTTAASESMVLGGYASTNYNTAGASFAGNDLYLQSPSVVWRDNGTTKTQAQFDARFGASGSYADPLFYDLAGNDFTLQDASPALSLNGSLAGAFPRHSGNVAPAITTQPTNATVTAGGTATFTVAATGSPTPTYQWRKNGSDILGATSASYTTPATTLGDNGAIFTVVVTNVAGNATSANATLTVNAANVAPAITTQPTNATVTAGGTATFTVAATGSPTPTYQWRKNGVNISGATSASYTTPATTLGDHGAIFTVVVTNVAGNVTSANATLTVNAANVAPAITTQPANATATIGGTATFTVVANGTPTPTYQWRKNGTDIVGATATSYTTSATTLADDAAIFTVVVSNVAGTATSAGATLSVTSASSPVVGGSGGSGGGGCGAGGVAGLIVGLGLMLRLRGRRR